MNHSPTRRPPQRRLIHKVRRRPPQRRFVDNPPSEFEWQAVHRVADKGLPLLERILLDAWGQWRGGIDTSAIFDALVSRNIPVAISLAQSAWIPAGETLLVALRSELMDILENAAQATLPETERVISDALGADIKLTLDAPANPRVQQYINDHGAALVTQIGETERDAIRQLILDAATKGRSPIETARDIEQFIGLSQPQMRKITRMREAMESAGIRQDLIDRRIGIETRKGIKARARVIARHESVSAANQGLFQTHQEAVVQGIVDPQTMRKRFTTTPDARTCPICDPMNRQVRGLDEPFESPFNGASRLAPPMHIQCRCSFVLVRARDV